jgi:phosphoribosylformylglycinamidine (FGAM) synthase-like amidotransferase family enzyme
MKRKERKMKYRFLVNGTEVEKFYTEGEVVSLEQYLLKRTCEYETETVKAFRDSNTEFISGLESGQNVKFAVRQIRVGHGSTHSVYTEFASIREAILYFHEAKRLMKTEAEATWNCSFSVMLSVMTRNGNILTLLTSGKEC